MAGGGGDGLKAHSEVPLFRLEDKMFNVVFNRVGGPTVDVDQRASGVALRRVPHRELQRAIIVNDPRVPGYERITKGYYLE